MNFSAPWFLWGALAALIPVLIHLVNRWRHRTMDWAAMQFLLRATEKSRGRKNLRNLLILTCRALAVAALFLALARPIAGGWLGWTGSSSVDTILVLLDRSASMEQLDPATRKTKREQGLVRLSQALEELDSGAKVVLLDSATLRPREIADPSVLPEVEAAAATSTAADMGALFQAALDYLATTKPAKSEIWVVSDLETSSWQPEGGKWAAVRSGFEEMPTRPKVRLLAFRGESVQENLTLNFREAQREGGDLVVGLEILQPQDRQRELTLAVRLEDARFETKVELDSQSLRMPLRIPLGDREGAGWGSVSLPADSNLQDNRVFFAFGERLPLHSGLVAPVDRPARLVGLAAAPPQGDREVLRVTPENAHTVDWENSAAVWWMGPLPEGPVADELTRFLEAGGVVLFFPPGLEDSGSFEGVAWSAIEDAPAQATFEIVGWVPNEGPLANAEDGFPLPVDRMEVIRRQLPVGDLTELASYADDVPFLARKVVGKGAAFFCSTLPDERWSGMALPNRPDALVLAVMMQRMLGQGGGKLGSARLAEAGESLPGLEEGVVERLLPEGPGGVQLTQAGLYRYQGRFLALNRPIQETGTEFLEENEVDQVFGSLPYSLFEVGGGQQESLVSEIWRTFVMVVLLLLLAEAFLSLPPARRVDPLAPQSSPV
ncbi:MAG: BatA domain-containing protein [Verrucomicrobiota bacterium]